MLLWKSLMPLSPEVTVTLTIIVLLWWHIFRSTGPIPHPVCVHPPLCFLLHDSKTIKSQSDIIPIKHKQRFMCTTGFNKINYYRISQMAFNKTYIKRENTVKYHAKFICPLNDHDFKYIYLLHSSVMGTSCCVRLTDEYLYRDTVTVLLTSGSSWRTSGSWRYHLWRTTESTMLQWTM